MRQSPAWPIIEACLALSGLAILIVKFQLLWRLNINWDEFIHLAKIHEFARGELRDPLQSFHVHLFGWLTGVSGNEADQVLAGRIVAFLMTLGGCVCLWLIGRELLGRVGAWFALLASLTFSYGLRHAEAFRADPLIGFLFMFGAAMLVLRMSSVAGVAAAALAMALAMLVSIKSVLFLPAIAAIFGIAYFDGGRRSAVAGRAALFGAVALVAYAALYLWHTASLPAAPAVSATTERAAAVGERMLAIPRLGVLVESLAWDWAYWLFVAAGGALAVREARRDAADRRRGWLVLALVLPASSLFFYRNTFEYFYVMITPAASLATGLVAIRVAAALSARPALAACAIALLAAPMLAQAVSFYVFNRDDEIAPQRAVLEAVHEIFPEPVPYLDRCGMVASFPKAGPFMTTFVLTAYRNRGAPVMPDIVSTRRPVFILANVAGLDLSRDWEEIAGSSHRLQRRDFEFLRENYILHWGPIWVAGKLLSMDAAQAVPFEIAVPGPYTVESSGLVEIDGARLEAGAIANLTSGPHSMRSLAGTQAVALRYGKNLPRPSSAPPEGPLFTGLGLHRPPGNDDR